MRATLVVPDRDPAARSGGDRYDARVIEHWPADLRVCRAAGAWPHPARSDVVSLGRLLGAVGAGPVLLDGLVGSAVPDLVAASAAARPTAVLVHSTLSAGSGAQGSRAEELDEREGRALRSADLVLATSAWSAADLRRRYGIEGVVVARPGADPAPVSPGSAAAGTPQLLVLAALTPVKNHPTLLQALSRLLHHAWTLVLAGPATDPVLAEQLAAQARALGIAERTTWAGALDGAALAQTWAGTDLLVHPSRSETWGLVVTEAHARGIPAVVARGTGAEEALAGEAGTAVDVTHPGELSAVLHRWLTDPGVRESWRAAALQRRRLLTGWHETARVLHGALTAVVR